MVYPYLELPLDVFLASIFSIAALNLLEIESLHTVVVDFGVQAMCLPRNLVPALEIGVVLSLTRATENFLSCLRPFNDGV